MKKEVQKRGAVNTENLSHDRSTRISQSLRNTYAIIQKRKRGEKERGGSTAPSLLQGLPLQETPFFILSLYLFEGNSYFCTLLLYQSEDQMKSLLLFCISLLLITSCYAQGTEIALSQDDIDSIQNNLSKYFIYLLLMFNIHFILA
jgi:hypothetical protein